MHKHELSQQQIQVIHPQGMTPSDAQHLTVYGLNGCNEFITGIFVHDKEYPKAENETTDELRFRVAREVANGLPPTAQCDAIGRPIAHFIYSELKKDHCKK